MSRVSENSSHASLAFALNKAKAKMENLQLKGTTLRSMTKPSDNPVSNIEALTIGSQNSDIKQYQKNSDYALLHLNVAETTLEHLGDVILKAKDIAISQSSDLHNPDIRKSVANEIKQLRNQALSLANKRLGPKFLFGGHKTLEKPFNKQGEYQGDKGQVSIEVSKDFFVPINLNGVEIFYTENKIEGQLDDPLQHFKGEGNSLDGESKIELKDRSRELASEGPEKPQFAARSNVFSILESLGTALENNDPDLIQNLLEKIDQAHTRVVTLRTKIGSLVNSVESAKNTLETESLNNNERKSKLLDADVAELFTDISKQQAILQTTYKASQGLLKNNLMDFLQI
jgi:flagellar hook-associated protein 3 FlgL